MFRGLLVLLATLSGCTESATLSAPTSSDATTATADVAPSCELAQEVVVRGNQRIEAFGDTPNALLGPATGSFDGTLAPASGGPVDMVLVIDASLGEYRFTDATWSGSADDPEAGSCRPRLEVDFAATAQAEGWLDATFSSELVYDAGGASFESPVPLAAVEGSVAEDYEGATNTADLCFNATFEPEAARWTGWLAWRATDTGPEDNLAASFELDRAPTR